jgi:hypothetical protein
MTVVWEFDEEGWQDELSRAVAQAAVDGLRRYVDDVRCPVHGEPATILVRGRSTDTLQLDVQGCCDRLTEPVRAQIKELQRGDPEL